MRFQIANGNAPGHTASATPISDGRIALAQDRQIRLMPLSMMNSGAMVATAGSISTPRTAIISTSRPRKRSREKAYAASTPIPTENSATVEASMKLFLASSKKLMLSVVGWARTRANASSDAPGGIRLSGRDRFRGSRAREKMHRIGNSTVNVISRQMAWSSS